MEAYSAGLMSQSFWFIEFKKCRLTNFRWKKAKTEIKSACIEEKSLWCSQCLSIKADCWILDKQVRCAGRKRSAVIMESDPATQKLLNLIAILRTDRLFFEFLFDVYREKIILGIPIMETRDANILFQ